MKHIPHICIISCQHLPDDMRVTHKIGMSFRNSGYSVTWVGPEREKKGSDYGIQFIYYKPAATRNGRILHSIKAYEYASKVDNVDVYFAVEPDSAVVAILLSRKNNAIAVFDIHEMFDGEMLDRWLSNPILKVAASFFVRKGIGSICNWCDIVAAVSETVMSSYQSHCPNSLILRSCAPFNYGKEYLKLDKQDDTYFTIMHGKSTLAHGTIKVLSAVKIAKEKCPNIRVVLFDAFGDHPESFDKQEFWSFINSNGLNDNIMMLPKVSYKEVQKILSDCDVGMIAYDRKWGVNSLPNKLFEYMALGKPIIAPIYSKEISKIIDAERCGILVDCENEHELSAAIMKLYMEPETKREMGVLARNAFLERHNWEKEVAPLFSVIDDLLRLK